MTKQRHALQRGPTASRTRRHRLRRDAYRLRLTQVAGPSGLTHGGEGIVARALVGRPRVVACRGRSTVLREGEIASRIVSTRNGEGCREAGVDARARSWRTVSRRESDRRRDDERRERLRDMRARDTTCRDAAYERDAFALVRSSHNRLLMKKIIRANILWGFPDRRFKSHRGFRLLGHGMCAQGR